MPDDILSPGRILIVGASARAAAASAARCGLQVFALDLFADSDLSAVAHAQRIAGDYPRAALNMAARLPAMPWMYTGGIENYVQLIRELAAARPLLGNDAPTVRNVRDHRALAELAGSSGFCYPETRDRPPEAGQLNDQWLVKPRHSCGGGKVLPWPRPTTTKRHHAETLVWQRRIPGVTYSAAYVADGASSQLLGVTRQLLAGEQIPGTVKALRAPFAYVGSVGPLALSAETRRPWVALGQTLCNAFQLVGLFGVDAIMDGRGGGRLTLIEVNPRYTASMELIEMATRQSMVRWHTEACLGRPLAALPQPAGVVSRRQLEKHYVFANEPITVTEPVLQRLRSAPRLTSGHPRYADIPRLGTQIAAGQPIHTRFAETEAAADTAGDTAAGDIASPEETVARDSGGAPPNARDDTQDVLRPGQRNA